MLLNCVKILAVLGRGQLIPRLADYSQVCLVQLFGKKKTK